MRKTMEKTMEEAMGWRKPWEKLWEKSWDGENNMQETLGETMGRIAPSLTLSARDQDSVPSTSPSLFSPVNPPVIPRPALPLKSPFPPFFLTFIDASQDAFPDFAGFVLSASMVMAGKALARDTGAAVLAAIPEKHLMGLWGGTREKRKSMKIGNKRKKCREKDISAEE